MATQSSTMNMSGAGLTGIRLAKWKWLALRGGLALLLGLAAFLFPASALFAFTLVFAAFAFVDGLLSIGSGIGTARRKEAYWWAWILRGLVGIAVGAIFVLMPFVATIGYALATLAVTAAWRSSPASSKCRPRSACASRSRANGCCSCRACSRWRSALRSRFC